VGAFPLLHRKVRVAIVVPKKPGRGAITTAPVRLARQGQIFPGISGTVPRQFDMDIAGAQEIFRAELHSFRFLHSSSKSQLARPVSMASSILASTRRT